jgi:glycosyltransferase involved in cell wall biosynthesis
VTKIKFLRGRECGLPLVSVVIPAFNAEQTIDRTLASVRAQTHEYLEIIVVDDGSSDDTKSRVLRHAGQDSRIRLIQQQNGGVAFARNRGISESQSHFVAPVDADDLWHPTKIARQLAVLHSSPEVGLVATAYSVIDVNDNVIAEVGGTIPPRTRFEDLCRRNFIGNGSSALMRRCYVERFGGYDPSLRQRGGQGCEDLQLYLQIAEVAGIILIPDPLTAYRRGPENMSCDARQMTRSFDLVAESFCKRRPELRSLFSDHRIYMLCWLLNGAIKAGEVRQAGEIARQILRAPSIALPAAILGAVTRTIRGASKRWLIERGRRPPLPWAQAVDPDSKHTAI